MLDFQRFILAKIELKSSTKLTKHKQKTTTEN